MRIEFILATAALVYMAFGYILVRHIHNNHRNEPGIMMSGFDELLYEEGRKSR